MNAKARIVANEYSKNGVQMGYLEVNTRAFDEECVNKNQQKEGELCQKSAKSPEIYLQMIKAKKAQLK